MLHGLTMPVFYSKSTSVVAGDRGHFLMFGCVGFHLLGDRAFGFVGQGLGFFEVVV